MWLLIVTLLVTHQSVLSPTRLGTVPSFVIPRTLRCCCNSAQTPGVLAPGRPPPDTLSRISRAWPTSLRIITGLRHAQYTTCQSFDKGFVEFFKKFMGVVKRITENAECGWGIVFWLAGMASLYMGWWGYGGVQGLAPDHV